MNYLLSFTLIDKNTPFIERLSLSGISAIVGISIVFAVLALLIGAILLLNRILDKLENKPKEKTETVVPAPVVEIAEPVQIATSDNTKIIAVITAALTVAAFDKPNARFIVKKIKKL